jgi:NAD+ synthase (glutamine-hydrolysing)
MLQITIAQQNLTIGDLQGNLKKMVAAGREAWALRSDLVVFPELALTGYYPGDLLDEPGFLDQVESAFQSLLQASRQIPALHWVVGLPARRQGPGKPLHNVLRVVANGATLLEYAKQLLPTYNVFDERRHFEPGPDTARVLRIRDSRVGFLICEDGWNDGGADYGTNPFQRLREAAPDLVISINASPSNIGKRAERHRILGEACRRNRLPLLYVNQVGGHDQLVYDGASFAVEPEAGVVYEAPRFEEALAALRFEGGRFVGQDGRPPQPVRTEGLPRSEFYRRQIVLGLRDYARRCGFRRAVVGCSGGIDSALTLALAVEALGADQVSAVTMPSRFSSAGSVDDSQALCAALGVPLLTHPIAALVEDYSRGFEQAFGQALEGIALENVQARTRGTILMEYSNTFGHLLLTTGNKSEMSVGYCTLYGDTNGGLGLIGDLYKTEVFALARHLNACAGRELIPRAILEKPPSAELAPGQKDTDSLPPYEVLDEVLKWIVEGRRAAAGEPARARDFVARLAQDSEGRALVQRIQGLVARSEYKRRQAPPVIRVRGLAFGTGRQMPIAARRTPDFQGETT